MVDLTYAMSSFLQFRTVYDKNISFGTELGIPRRMETTVFKRTKADSESGRTLRIYKNPLWRKK
mgnify:CR=1 FL=1